MFLPNGKGSPLLFAQWRTKGAVQPIQSAAILVDGGLATRYFSSLWSASFPTRNPLPKAPLVNRDGTATDAFWEVFA